MKAAEPGQQEAADRLPEIRVVPDAPGSSADVAAASGAGPIGRSVLSLRTEYDSEDEEEQLFKPFTPSSYERLLVREKEDREKAELGKNSINEGRLVDGELKFDDDEEGEGEKLEPDPALKEGGPLPSSLAEEFPKELLRKPVEEIDPAIRDKTFVVISSRFKKKYIYRFSATKALFLLTPWNPLRRLMITIATNQFFDYFIILTILLNMLFMAFHQGYSWLVYAEYVFTAIYSVEMLIKVFARGFVIYKYTYLRDPWNWIDFVVIIAAYLTVILEKQNGTGQVRSLSALKTLRVFRAFKTVSVMPGLKMIISALIRSMRMLIEVVLLKLFCMMVFALFALQVYMGSLRQKCVKNIDPSLQISDSYYMEYVKNESNWYSLDDDYIICGNASGAGKCPTNYTCLPNVGENPNWGYTTFDNFGWALLNAFQLITLDFWEDLYDKVIRASGPWNIVFFILVVFFGSFYLLNMMLAVVNMAYEEEVSNFNKEKERDRLDEKLRSARKRSKEAKRSLSRRQRHKGEQKTDDKHLHVIGAVKGSNTASSASLKSVGNGVLHKNTLSPVDGAKNKDATPSPVQGGGSGGTASEASNKPPGKEKLISKSLTKPKLEGIDNPVMITDDEESVISSENNGDPPVVITTDDDDDQLVDRNCECCGQCCRVYICCLKFQNFLNKVISEFAFEIFITFCIALNVIFMAIEHHGMSSTLETALKIANYIFTGIFILEAAIKMMALSRFYFKSGWNVFDLIIVGASIIDLGLEDIDGLSVFRAFRLLRLLRVFKLAQTWTTMRMLLSIILRTLGALGNLTIVLFIVAYIFAVIGMQVFGTTYTEEVFAPDPIPRWNFKDFYHAIILVFRILCGEWIEPLWDCMRANGEVCMAVFLPTLVFGNLMVLNLFLALLLNSFATDSLQSSQDKDSQEDSKMKKGWNRIKNMFKRRNKVKQEDDTRRSMASIVSDVLKHEKDSDLEDDDATNRKNGIESGTNNDDDNKDNKSIKSSNAVGRKVYNEFDDVDDESNGLEPGEIYPFFPKFFYKIKCCMTCQQTKYGIQWIAVRKAVFKVTEHKAFEWFILFIIMASSISLCFDDIYLYQKPTMLLVLTYMDMVYAAIFVIEMVLKMIGIGWKKYFTSFWTILDFSIVVISLISIAAGELGLSDISSFRALRTLRALRPLRAISRWQGMKIVVNALMHAIPSIFNVLLVCLVFWLIFSIAGVQLFGGKFYKCVDANKERYDASIVPNRTACEALAASGVSATWINSNVHFDHVGAGYLALFQVATFEGWIEVMRDAIDATEVDIQPRDEAQFANYIYFVIFIICGSFFTLNLFIGVIIDNFNMLKKKYECGYVDVLLTQSQKNYYNTMKKLGNRKPQKTIKRPKNRVQAFFFDVSVSSKFELAIVILIFLNMISMGFEHYNQPQTYADALDIMNIIFTTIFTLEAIVKIIGMRWHYFRRTWNVFDFLIVILSVLGVVLDDILQDVFVTPNLLRVVRVFRIGRVLRLIKVAKGVRKLLFALMISLPALFNICMLLFLIVFIYAIFGMSLFGHVKPSGSMNDVVNFQTFGNSMLLLFRLTTAGGWNEILDALFIREPDCNPENFTYFDGTVRQVTRGECGNPGLAVFFMVTFVMLTYLVIINMYIAVILENFSQAHEQEEVGITEDDFEMFYVIWERYDPHATQFIKYDQLSDFVADLDQPLGMPKPNEIALVAFDLPIYEGDRLHCLDILTSLVKHVLGAVEMTDEFRNLKEQVEQKFREEFPTRIQQAVRSTTMRRKKEDVAAKTLQRAWRKHKAASNIRRITQMAMEMKREQTRINEAAAAAAAASAAATESGRPGTSKSGSKTGPKPATPVARPVSPRSRTNIKAAHTATQVRQKSSVGRRMLVPSANDISLPSDNADV